jgi:hypothetical protein
LDIHAAPSPSPYICEEESFHAIEGTLFSESLDAASLRRAFLSNPRGVRRAPHSPPPSASRSLLTPLPNVGRELEQYRVGRFYVVATRMRM